MLEFWLRGARFFAFQHDKDNPLQWRKGSLQNLALNVWLQNTTIFLAPNMGPKGSLQFLAPNVGLTRIVTIPGAQRGAERSLHFLVANVGLTRITTFTPVTVSSSQSHVHHHVGLEMATRHNFWYPTRLKLPTLLRMWFYKGQTKI